MPKASLKGAAASRRRTLAGHSRLPGAPPGRRGARGGRAGRWRPPAFPAVTCSNGSHGDMFMNYMDYVDDAAMFLFTAQQVVRIRTALEESRPGLR